MLASSSMSDMSIALFIHIHTWYASAAVRRGPDHHQQGRLPSSLAESDPRPSGADEDVGPGQRQLKLLPRFCCWVIDTFCDVLVAGSGFGALGWFWRVGGGRLRGSVFGGVCCFMFVLYGMFYPVFCFLASSRVCLWFWIWLFVFFFWVVF